MKKNILTVLAIILAVSLTACGGGASDGSVKGDFIMATGGTSGTYYAYGGMICQVLNQATGANISANSTGASVENIRLLNSNEVDFGIVQTDILAYAIQGINAFEADGAISNVKAIASMYPELVQVVTTDMSLNSIDDLRGKAVSIGAAGSGVEINARQFLAAYGMTYDDIDERFLSFAESADALQDGTIAAAFIVAGIPNSAIQQLSVAKPVKLLSLDKEHSDKLIAEYPFFSEYTVGKDVYGSPEDATTLAIKAVLAVSAKMSDNDVYAITKALFDKQPELAQIHDKGKELSKDTCMAGLVSGNIHPGAAKYYAEIGVKLP